MEIHILADNSSIFNEFIAEIRNVEVQVDSMRFRRNMERMGEIFAYEISKHLSYQTSTVQTPLAEAQVSTLKDQPVIATILRAGLALHQGIANCFDRAGNGFVSAYRDGDTIKVEYLASPSLQDKVLVLSDPMLATGRSMELSYKALLKNGTPKYTHIVSAIASKKGVEHINENLPANTTLWVGALDDELTSKAYITPGLGDAGDLAYGDKM